MKTLILVVLVAVSLLPSLTHAQATRTWVSGVGNDANPCSRTAPCQTFAGAISKTATNGVIDVLDPGGFGAVTITKSITIEGDGAEGAILIQLASAIVINASSTDVVILRNLTLEGVGGVNAGLAGIQILSAGAVHVENCRINGFTTSGINFVDSAAGAQLFVKDTTIHNCTPSGINLAPSGGAAATALIERVNITGCGGGVDAGANTRSVVTDTTVSGNSGVGFLAASGAQLTINRGNSSDNNVGVESSGEVVLSNSTVANNAADGLKVIDPGEILSLRNNAVFGNSPDGKATSRLRAK